MASRQAMPRAHSIGTNRPPWPGRDLFPDNITRLYVIRFLFILDQLMSKLLVLIEESTLLSVAACLKGLRKHM